MRLDLLLCRLRFAKTRALAQKQIESGHMRHNGERVTRTSHPVEPGDVLTLPIGKRVRIIELVTLPPRRGPGEEARACYRDLDPNG